MATPIYNPPIPYIGAIPGGVNPGRMIRIQGTPTAVSNRFAINLQCGPNPPPRDEIGLHMDFRFAQTPPCVVRNSLIGQQWGHEESHGHFPLARGQHFEVLILVEHTSYKIAINGQHYAEFNHRVPFARVTYVGIDGEVQISAITYEGTIGGVGAGHTPDIGFSTVVPPMPGAVHVMPMPMPGAHVQPHPVGGHPVGGHPVGGHPVGGHPVGGHPHPGGAHTYPAGVHSVTPVVYPVGAVHGYPGQHGHQPQHGYPSHGQHGYPGHGHSAAIPIAAGVGMGAMGAMAYQGQHSKKQKKAMKKAMKHHKHKQHHGMHGMHGHHHGKSSSSSSSSSSEEE